MPYKTSEKQNNPSEFYFRLPEVSWGTEIHYKTQLQRLVVKGSSHMAPQAGGYIQATHCLLNTTEEGTAHPWRNSARLTGSVPTMAPATSFVTGLWRNIQCSPVGSSRVQLFKAGFLLLSFPAHHQL